MKDYLQISIEVSDGQEKDILIAELISIGFDSFEEAEGELKAYINEADFQKESFSSLINKSGKKFAVHTIQEKNWNEEWEKNFAPVVIGNYCTVRADFHKPDNTTKHEIVITPKMSFGTGHHATTYLMLQMMKDLELKDQQVFDFGTGTGILAIMAEKLGAKEVLAIDIDEWSIRNAEENLIRNNCHRVQLVLADNIPTDKSFKIILANINRNVILERLPDMCKILEAKGEILLSGLMEIDFEQVHLKCSNLGFELQKKGEKSGWIALRYILRS